MFGIFGHDVPQSLDVGHGADITYAVLVPVLVRHAMIQADGALRAAAYAPDRTDRLRTLCVPTLFKSWPRCDSTWLHAAAVCDNQSDTYLVAAG